MGNRKQGICMADGGITQESPEQLMARMAAKYGAPTGATQQAQPQQQSTQQAPQQPQQKSGGLGILSLLKGRSAQIDKAVNGYADGGIAGHVKFEGKGGPREDQIPVKVAGQKINVSDGEQALIIPAKTAANAQAMEMIKKIIADSNDGRQPDMGHGDSNFAEGGLLDDEARKMDYQAVTGIQAPEPTPQPAAQPASGGWSLGKSGPGATLQVTTGDTARLPAPAVQQGIATMRNQLATPQPAAASGSNYVGNGPTDPDTNGRQAIAAPSNAVQRGIETMRGQLNQNPAPSENALASAAENERIKSLYPAGTFDKPAVNPMASTNIPGVSAAVAATQPPSASPSSVGDDLRAKHQSILNGQQSVADQGALDAMKASAPAKDGILRVTEMPAGSKAPMGSGYDAADRLLGGRDISKQKLITNVGGDGTAGMSASSVNTRGIVDQSQGNPNLGTASDNLRQIANIKALQEMTPQGGIGILGDGGIEAANAEKTARWRQDAMLSGLSGRARTAAMTQVIAGQNQMAVAELQQQTAMRGQDAQNGTTARGQDIQSRNEAARLAGNPVENQLKQAQTQGIMATTESATMLADIQKKALAGDPQAMASYLALTGKKPSAATDRFMTVQGGEEVGPDGMTKIKKPSGVFDAQTQQFVSMNGGQPNQKQAAPASAIDYLKKNPGQAEAFKAKYGYLPEGM